MTHPRPDKPLPGIADMSRPPFLAVPCQSRSTPSPELLRVPGPRKSASGAPGEAGLPGRGADCLTRCRGMRGFLPCQSGRTKVFEFCCTSYTPAAREQKGGSRGGLETAGEAREDSWKTKRGAWAPRRRHDSGKRHIFFISPTWTQFAHILPSFSVPLQ